MAARFTGAKGALPVTVDGEMAAAWIMAGVVKVVFAFHVEDGLVREIELIADPDVLATLDVVLLDDPDDSGHRRLSDCRPPDALSATPDVHRQVHDEEEPGIEMPSVEGFG